MEQIIPIGWIFELSGFWKFMLGWFILSVVVSLICAPILAYKDQQRKENMKDGQIRRFPDINKSDKE